MVWGLGMGRDAERYRKVKEKERDCGRERWARKGMEREGKRTGLENFI